MARRASGRAAGEAVSVDGHRVVLTNLDKVLYPATGTTKGEVIDYYARVAEWMLPHVADRPATRKRWADGVDHEPFFQKNLEDSAPSWVRRRELQHKDHANEYPLVNDLATLTWLGQIAALEIHVPQWRFGARGARKNPDRLVLDLDPGEGVGLAECVQVAKLARAILRDVGLDPLPVTSGSKGIHLYTALDGKLSSDDASAFAKELARALEADHPELVVSDMKKALRHGKVLVDWSQNNGSKTTVAPYSLRGRERPTVAAPRTWRELAAKDLAQLEFGEVLTRLARRGDPLAEVSAGHPDEPLGAYRAKRREGVTPEPFGDERHRARRGSGPDAGDPAPIFVIQEHHASRLHWDFRLERDGVLVSWALPKGVPTEPKRNHLAVQTEDHPLDYADFAGDIPAGEYGAGHVDIWDAGHYELEKWRDGEEVIATLHGERGDHRYALIHTDGDQWLIHLMKQVDEKGGPARRPPARTAGRTGRTGRTPSATGATRRPMLATLGDESSVGAEADGDWCFEMKWDGVRALATVRDGAVTVRSRNGLDLTPTFPELAELADRLGSDAVVDGEIVALDRTGRPDFGRLQRRLGLTTAREVATAARAVSASFLAFDLLELDGEDLVDEPYDRRRRALAAALRPAGAIQVPGDAGDDLEAALATSRELRLEGVMAKRRDSRYRVGRRSRDWIKIKHHLAQEVVVVGWRPGSGRRAESLGSLLLAVPEDGALHYVGRVGTGFREAELAELRRRLGAMARKTAPLDDVPDADARDAHWVTPSLVAEVEYAELTADGRLRQPSWRGRRPDKDPDEVRWELPG